MDSRVWADLVVLIHALYVGFVVFGLLAILLGVVLRWNWVRNFWFRTIHVAAISIVVVESLLNIVCPLTTLENQLRQQAGEEINSPESFIGRWIHAILFYDVPSWVLTLCYGLFGAAVLATMLFAPPRWPWKGKK